jgi:hypothetical protein
MSNYERNKASYYRWIQNNPEKYALNNKRQQEKRLCIQRKMKTWDKISVAFRNILIDDS